jgi:hypothetical protein
MVGEPPLHKVGGDHLKRISKNSIPCFSKFGES